MKKIIITLMVIFCMATAPVFAGDMSHMKHGNTSKNMASHDMDMGAKGMDMGTFKHSVAKDGVRADFEIMSMESMNMKDPDGATHHIMVKFFKDSTKNQLKDVAGKIKIISPSKKEFTGTLKDYSGVYASTFTADEKGKYGIICLFKIDGKKRVVKFWYNNQG